MAKKQKKDKKDKKKQHDQERGADIETAATETSGPPPKMRRKEYEAELRRLHGDAAPAALRIRVHANVETRACSHPSPLVMAARTSETSASRASFVSARPAVSIAG